MSSSETESSASYDSNSSNDSYRGSSLDDSLETDSHHSFNHLFPTFSEYHNRHSLHDAQYAAMYDMFGENTQTVNGIPLFPQYDITYSDRCWTDKKRQLHHFPGVFPTAERLKQAVEYGVTMTSLKEICQEHLGVMVSLTNLDKVGMSQLVSRLLLELLIKGDYGEYNRVIALILKYGKAPQQIKSGRIPLKEQFVLKKGQVIMDISQHIFPSVEWPLVKPLIVEAAVTPVISLDCAPQCSAFNISFEAPRTNGEHYFLYFFHLTNEQHKTSVRRYVEAHSAELFANIVETERETRLHYLKVRGQEVREIEQRPSPFLVTMKGRLPPAPKLKSRNLNLNVGDIPAVVEQKFNEYFSAATQSTTTDYIENESNDEEYHYDSMDEELFGARKENAEKENIKDSNEKEVPLTMPCINLKKEDVEAAYTRPVGDLDLFINNRSEILVRNGQMNVLYLNSHLSSSSTTNTLWIRLDKPVHSYLLQIVKGRVNMEEWTRQHGEQVPSFWKRLDAEAVKQKFFLSPEKVSKQAEEAEIESLDITLSLKCPITLARIKTPVRGERCTHLACFDPACIPNLLNNDPHPFSRGHLKCPHCAHNMVYKDLVVDGYVQGILDAVGPDVEEVLIDAKTGEWRVKGGMKGGEAAGLEDPQTEERMAKVMRLDRSNVPMFTEVITSSAPAGKSFSNAIEID